jgi:hypothetical protein
VRRVTRYSGRANFWLAAAVGVLYSAHTIAGPAWPSWLGQLVFRIFALMGGIPMLSTALVVLAAVPAAFQYGLWDSNDQDRCRRLELLLLSQFDAWDYWHAALAAAWRRGRGYLGVAMLLWTAALIAGQIQPLQFVAVVVTSGLLWGVYFALGFRAFSRGRHANGLGSFLTLGLPLVTYALYQSPWARPLAELLPPGSVYRIAAEPPNLWWLMGPLAAGVLALAVTRTALTRCDAELRHWYELHHGKKLAE